MTKILVTGGDGRFSKTLKKLKSKYNFIFTNKKQLDINNYNSIIKNLKKYKPKYLLHLAGLSRPMSLHEKNISKSINANIKGTCNLVMACEKNNIKIIYFSTNYLYPGKKGNYKETDPLLPWNNYGWSKLGGECAVQMYKNSLILRVCMTEKPFVHNEAYTNVKSNFDYHENIAQKILKLFDKRGIINVGGKSQSIYKFVFKDNKDIKKKYSKGEFPTNQTMNLSKLKAILNK